VVKTFAEGSVRQVGLPKNQAGWWTAHDLPNEGFYYVLWDTRQPALVLTKYYRVNVLLAGNLLGFADVDPMDNMREFRNARTGDVIPFVDDATLAIPFRVEKGALCEGGTCNSATITRTSANGTGTQSVIVDAGGGSIAGALFSDGWLPSLEQCPNPSRCPQQVVVTVTEVNTAGSGLPGEPTICHPALNSKLIQFRGCFNYTTTPALDPFNGEDQFAAEVMVAVCYELEGTNDPRRDFAELYASGPGENEPPHALTDERHEGVLVATKDCTNPPPVLTLRSSNPLVQLASTGWQKFKVGLDQVFSVKTAHAVDLGLGGIVKGFSNISPVLTASIEAYTSTELTLQPGATTTSTVRIMGSHQHLDAAPTGIPGVTVTFLASGSSTLSAATVTTAADGTASVNWTMPAGGGPYTLTADGPALGGPVIFTSTVVPVTGVIDFEHYPNGVAVCGGLGACLVSNEFVSRGVVFSFDVSGFTKPSLCRTIHGPIGEGSNYGVSGLASDTCSSWASGTVTMSFATHPTTVEFQLEGNDGSVAGAFPVTAFDASGNAVTVTRLGVPVTYLDQFGNTFRREIRQATSTSGIASIAVNSVGVYHNIDNLLITP
jgi:hypothetical protein